MIVSTARIANSKIPPNVIIANNEIKRVSGYNYLRVARL